MTLASKPSCIASLSAKLLLASWVIFVTSLPVDGAEKRREISFVNDVVPILTKSGCNAGACHAKAGGGQNGFQLSLLGFEPKEDYESIVKEGSGRRIFRSAPTQSLLLGKTVGELPHGGGVRLKKDSQAYSDLLTWIQQGALYSNDSERKLSTLEISPKQSVLQMGSQQQLKMVATYSDGSTRDVTNLSLFESNTVALADVDENGLVQVNDIPGKVSVMVRFQGQVTVFTASVPSGKTVVDLPPEKNFIDQHVFSTLKTIGIPASSLSDDATFLRRITLDVAGRIPTQEESAQFLNSSDPDKRNQVIDRLLRSPGYADFFANKWTSLLKNRRDETSDITSNFAFHAWIRDSLLTNVPYDQLVRELLAATGTVIGNPPVAWYKRVKDPKQQLEDVAQLFLGVRMQCAQCHHHPFERWSQDDYYQLSAFFAQVGRKPTGTRGEDLIYHQRGLATAVNVKTGVSLRPAALGDDVGEISPDDDPRLRLADWMSSKENPFFAKALVNRYWKHFFKVGLVEPEDDIRDTNPATNPELLTALEQSFIASGFDLKQLVRTITQSNAYQLSSQANEYNLADVQNYSRYYPRRLQAEVLLDAIDDLTGNQSRFANLPAGTRAVALPDNSYNKSSALLRVFGRPDNSSVCECERVQSSSLAQSLYMINSSELRTKLTIGSGKATQLAKSKATFEERISELYLTAFARQPRADELQTALEYMHEPITGKDGKPLSPSQANLQNFKDLIWALINSKEFLFNH